MLVLAELCLVIGGYELFLEGKHLLRALEPVHHRHVQVHEHQRILPELALWVLAGRALLNQIGFEHLEPLLAVIGYVCVYFELFLYQQLQ